MDVGKYLERIGYRGGREPSAANLAALVKAHRFAVPYETLDLWRGRHVTLATEEIYDKVVTRRRGGYCFELNGLFAWLLRELGYNVREYFGRWHFGEDLKFPKRRHRVVVVSLAKYPNLIADVGIGLPFLMGPIKFVFDEVQVVGRQTYRIVRDAMPTPAAVVEVQKRDGSWDRVFSFDTSPQLPIDFAYAHYWCKTHPTSDFRKKVWVFLPSDDGSMRSIASELDPETGELTPVLALTAPDGKQTKVPLRTEDRLAEALHEHFGIVEVERFKG